MIKNPIILWIILVFQILFLILFIGNMIKLGLEGLFFPTFFIEVPLTLALIWVTLSHIKLLSKSKPTDADPFS